VSRERLLRRRLRTLATLDEVIGALRSLSAQHFRAARAPLRDARAYRDEVERFLAVLPQAPTSLGSREARPSKAALHGTGSGDHAEREPLAEPAADAPTGVVLITADLGLVGDYTAQLVREALALREQHGAGPLLCLGQRALGPLARAGVAPASVQPAPTSVAGLAGTLLPLVDALLALRAERAFGSLWLVAARFEGAGRYAPMRVSLLPVRAPADGARLPASPYGDADHLRAVVLREYLYASLYVTLLEALASEHGKRLAMAEAARSWLAERMQATRRLVASIRRETSTQEVLEVAVAARAPGLRP
jgi:F0F1-type ATP synthase gamma subunit